LGLAPASTRLASSRQSDRRRASSAPEDIGRASAEAGDEGGETHERRRTFAASRRPNRTCQARRPTMKAAVRDLTPEIKTEFRKVLDKALPKDPELRAKIIAIYSQSPVLKRFYEEAGFEVTHDNSRR
jgi:hypothetical protein